MKKLKKAALAAFKVLLVAAFFLQCMDFFALQPSATSEVITGVVDIDTSRYATYILLQDKRTLLTAGYNDNRKLGRPELAVNVDAKFGTADISMVQGEIQSISVSQTNGVLVDDYGNVYLVGEHDWSQFGDGSTADRNEAKFLKIDTSPITNAGAKAVKAYAGYHYIVILDNQGNIWGAGKNSAGELGLGGTGEINRVTKIPGVANVVDVQTTPDGEGGLTATTVLQADGRVFVSGNNYAGSFGLGNANAKTSFVQYPITDVKQINQSNYNLMVLTNGGELYASGYNQWGMFGNGSGQATNNTPQNISAKLRGSTIGGSTRDWNVAKILPSQTAAWVQLDDGTVWAAGTNNGSWGDLGYRFTTRTTGCGGENECWFHDVSNPVKWDQEASRGAVVYKSDEASTGFDLSYPSDFSGTWEGGILIDKNGTLLIVGNSNHGELGVKYADNPKATLFKPIVVERFIFNPVLDFYEGDTKLSNTDTIIDPTSIVIGPKQWDTAVGAPEVQAYWKIYKASAPGTVLKSGNSVITDDTLKLTVSTLKLPPEEYVIEVYRKTTNGALTSTTVAKKFRLTTPLTTPVIHAEDKVIQLGDTFDPMVEVSGIDEFRDDVTASVQVTSNSVNVNQLGSYKVAYRMTTTLGTVVTKNRTITVVDSESVYDEHNVLHANGWVMQSSEVAGLDNTQLISRGNAKAWAIATNTALPVTVNRNRITATPGTYEVEYTASGLYKTVYVTVTDDNTQLDDTTALYAKRFIIHQNDVAGITDANIISRAGARAWLTADNGAVNVTVDDNQMQSVIGTYNVRFKANDVTNTVKAVVIDDQTIYDDVTALRADNFIVTVQEAETLNNDGILTQSSAKAWLLADGTEVTPTIAANAIQAQAGVYSVQLQANNVTKTIYVTVTDKDTVIDKEKDTGLYAKSFTINTTDVAGLTKASVNTLAGAKAWKLSNGAVVSFNTDFAAIEAKAGVYPVTFTTETGVSKIVYATVKDGNTIIDDSKDTGLHAKSFIIDKADAASLDEAAVIHLADARAWKLSDGKAVDFTTNFSAIQAKAGVYPVTFTTETGVSKIVYATVSDEDTLIEGDTALYAHNFIVDKGEVSGLNQAGVVALAEAKAWKVSDGEPIGVTADYGQIMAVPGSYPVIFTTETGTRKTVRATVGDEHTEIVPEKNTALYALSFSLDKSEVAGLTADAVKTMAEAKAWQLSNGADMSSAIMVDYNAILAEEGEYDVIFTVNGVSLTVKATVGDKSAIDSIAINANNFIIDSRQASGLTANTVKTEAGATASGIRRDGVTVDLSSQLVVNYSSVRAEVGTYPATFSIDNVSKTIYITVKDEYTIIDEDKATALRAKSFTMPAAEVAGVTYQQINQLAGAKAWSLTDGSAVGYSTDFSALREKAGVYPITFRTDDGISKTVFATVIDENTKIDDDKDTALYAHNFIINKTAVAGLTADAVKTMAEAKAWKLSNGAAVNFTTDFSAIKAAAGAYPVTFVTETGVSKTIYATVKDENTVIDETKDTALYAKSFVVSTAEVAGLTDTSVISLANAKAWKLSDNSSVSMTVDRAQIEARVGVYPVTFTTANGVIRTVYATVKDSDTIIDENKDTALYAHSFVVAKADVNGLTFSDINQLAGAQAWYISNGTAMGYATNYSALKAEAGVYQIIFTTDTGLSKTVFATVEDENTKIDESKDTALYAKSFVVDSSEVADLTAASVTSRAQAKAWKLSDGSTVSFTVDFSKIRETAGVYPVTFETATGVSRTVYATVKDADTIIDQEKDTALHAKSFALDAADVEGITDLDINQLADARAWQLSNGAAIDYNTDFTALKAEAGVYPITFTTTTGVSKTVFATVTDTNTVIDEEKNNGIYAHNFIVDKDEVSSLDEARVITLAGAKAWKLSDGQPANFDTDFSELKAEAGVYPVTFETIPGVSRTVYATVKDENTKVDETKDTALYAHSFSIEKDDVAQLNTQIVTNLAEAKAWKLSDGKSVTFTVDYNAITGVAGVYPVTFETATGVSRTVYATVTDENTVINEEKDTAVYAIDFGLDVREVAALDVDAVKTLAAAKAWQMSTGADLTDSLSIDYSAIQAAVGTYNVTFTINGVTRTVNATVSDETMIVSTAVSASNFVIDSGAVAGLDDASVKTLASANAIGTQADGNTVDLTTSLTVDYSAIDETPGSYPVIFALNGERVTIYATVKDNNTTIDESNDTAIYAKSFVLDIAEVAALNEATVINKAEARAWQLSDNETIGFSTNFSAIEAKVGVYAVIFTAETGASRTVYATVKDADTTIDESKDTALYAHNFIVNVADAAELDEAGVVSLAEAKAWKLSDGKSVNFATDFTAIKAKPGVYAVIFETESGVSKTVYATVTDGDTVIDESKDTALYAHNFIVDTAEAATLNEAAVIDLAEAKAWNLSGTEPVDFTTDFGAIKAEAGVYRVIFTATTGVSRTVYATVTDENTTINETKDTAIYAKDFALDVSEVAGLYADNVKTLAAVKAWQLSNGADLTGSLAVDYSAVQAAVGTYDVTFKVNDVTHTVTATVSDRTTIVSTVVAADNFMIDSNEVADLTAASVKTLANATATGTQADNTVVDLTAALAVDYSAVEEALGSYPVTFSLNGESVTVYATVKNADTTIDDSKDTALHAHNFIIRVTEAAELDEATVVGLAEAKAWKLSDGKSVNFTTDFSAIKAEAGVYRVIFTTTSGVSKTVFATVEDADTKIDESKDTALYAHNFIVDATAVATLDDAAVNTLAGAKAWKLSDGESVNFTTDFTAVEAAAGAYPVTFTTASGVSKTVIATVKDANTAIDETKDTAVYAHNFIVDKAAVSTLDETAVVGLAEAKAWKLSDGESVNFTTDFGAIKAEAGVYRVIFTATTGVSRTVYATVTDENTTINETKDTAIYAKNFGLDVSEVAGLDADAVKTMAAAKAWLLSDGSVITDSLSVDYNAIQAAVGTYDVTFSVNGVTHTVTATVSDRTTVVSTVVDAENFIIDITDVADLDNNRVKTLANASATGTQADNNTVDLTTALAVDYSAVEEALGSYPVTFSLNGENKTVYAIVKDVNTIIDQDKDTALSAKSFIVASIDVAALNDAAVISLAQAQAWKLSDGSDASFTVNFSEMTDKAGVYPVTFATASGVSKTVYATVIDEDTKIDESKNTAIYAKDFAIDKSEVDALVTSTVKTAAAAKAWLLAQGTDVSDQLAVDFSAILAAEGTYPVSFSVNGVTHTVTATVGDKTVITTIDLQADNFVIHKDEVAALDQNDAIARANATATGTRRDGEQVDLSSRISADFSNVVAAPGAYPVTFSIESESVTVYVTVSDDDTTIDETQDTAVYAKDFVIDKSEVATLDSDSVKTLAAAKAWLLSAGSDISDQLAVDFSKILEAEGTYPVSFSVNGVTRTITVTVGDKTVIETVALSANNFIIQANDVSSLTAEQVKTSAALIANGTQRDGTVIDLVDQTTADYSAIAAVPGAYPVSFTVYGESKIVYATVYDTNTVIDEDKDTGIYAKGFTVSVDEAAALNDAAIISKAGAKAWLLSNADPATISIADNQVKAEVGAYRVVFTANDVEKAIMVNVIDNETVLDDDSALRANGFTVNINDVAALDDAAIITQADAKAWSLADGSVLPVAIRTNEIVEALGSYTVAFEANGLVKSVRVNVVDDATILGDTTAIRAEGFTLNVNDVAAFDDAAILAAADAKAWLLADNSEVAINIVANAIRAEVGAYAVTLQANEVTKTIMVSVVDDDTEIISGVAIHAKSFALKQGQVNDLTDDQVKKLAGLKAWDIVTGVYLTEQVVPDYTAVQPFVGNSYDVHFTLTRQRPNARGFVTADISISTRTVKATVLADDEAESPALPVTGTDSMEMMVLGLGAIVIAGAIGAYRKSKKLK